MKAIDYLEELTKLEETLFDIAASADDYRLISVWSDLYEVIKELKPDQSTE